MIQIFRIVEDFECAWRNVWMDFNFYYQEVLVFEMLEIRIPMRKAVY